MAEPSARTIPALKVHQWLAEWDEVESDPGLYRREPPKTFYMFTLNARDLKSLSGIQRRSRKAGEENVLGVQRRHEPARSREIAEFVRHGFPWSEMPEAKRESGKFDDLKKPGWLPTALVVNILLPDDTRRKKRVSASDLITISDQSETLATLTLPVGLGSRDWTPSGLFPIEVIDGQHRLWAFEDGDLGKDFDLPVIAFHGLDISWQAYLFWTINIKPKKINASLAFDLYPLLRSEDWLEKFEGHSIYRETRAQELVERLWSSSLSPWNRRINMLGEPGTRLLSQAAWVRALTATFVRVFDARSGSVGGLFGARHGEDELVLPWSRTQQAALLILAWREMKSAVWDTDDAWASKIRTPSPSEEEGEEEFLGEDDAFYGQFSLISQDQGVRTFLHVTNDLCWIRFDELELADWELENIRDADSDEAFAVILEELKALPVASLIRDACDSMRDSIGDRQVLQGLPLPKETRS